MTHPSRHEGDSPAAGHGQRGSWPAQPPNWSYGPGDPARTRVAAQVRSRERGRARVRRVAASTTVASVLAAAGLAVGLHSASLSAAGRTRVPQAVH